MASEYKFTQNQLTQVDIGLAVTTVADPNRVVVTSNLGYLQTSTISYSQLAALVATGAITANSGLTVNAGSVQLGGNLVQNTTISVAGFQFTISDTSLFGMKYGADYSALGKLNDRWIVDYGAVKNAAQTIPTLQTVTNVGNVTTNPIVISHAAPTATTYYKLSDTTNSAYLGLTFSGVPTFQRDTAVGAIQFRILDSLNGDVFRVLTDSTNFFQASPNQSALTIDHSAVAIGMRSALARPLYLASNNRGTDVVINTDASVTFNSSTTSSALLLNSNYATQTDGLGAATLSVNATRRIGIGANGRTDDFIIDTNKNFIIRDLGNTKSVSYLCDSTGKFRVNGVTRSINHNVDEVAISATTIDFDLGGNQYKDLSANTTFTFANSGAGKAVQVFITNTGGATITMTFTGATPPVGADQTILAGATKVFSFIGSRSAIYQAIVRY